VSLFAHNPEVAGSSCPRCQVSTGQGLIAGDGGRAFLLDGSTVAAGVSSFGRGRVVRFLLDQMSTLRLAACCGVTGMSA
jgi:hypothetical protein